MAAIEALSMWDSQEDPSMCVPCNEPREIFSVKNTFLHLAEAPRPAIRRSSSVPSFARLLSEGAKGASTTDGWADASTASEWDSDRESVGSSERVWTAADDHASVASEQPTDPEAPPSPQAAPVVGRTPLRSSAAAWTPGAAVQQATQADDFMCQLTMIVAAALTALAGCGPVYGAMASDGPRGVSMVAQIRPEDLPRRERALTVVKEALLQAAAASGNVYVLGYLAQPFVNTPCGFAVQLAASPPESEACWDVLKKGACRRGGACRWRHPTQQRTVNVMIQTDHSA